MNHEEVVAYLALETLDSTDELGDLETNIDYDLHELKKDVLKKARVLAKTYEFPG